LRLSLTPAQSSWFRGTEKISVSMLTTVSVSTRPGTYIELQP
jgi:hypothetical protein